MDKEFPLNAKNCKASLVISDKELHGLGMIKAHIEIDTAKTDYSSDLSVGLKPKLQTMIFNTYTDNSKPALDFSTLISGNHLVVSALRKPEKPVKKLIVHCKVNNGQN